MRIHSLAAVAAIAFLAVGQAQAQNAAAGPAGSAAPVQPVEVIKHVDVNPDEAKAAATASRAYAAAARAESGNLTVMTLVESGRPSRFVILERWKNDANYQASRKAKAALDLQRALSPIERAPVDERAQSDFLFTKAGTAAPTSVYVLTHVDVTPPKRPETEDLLKTLTQASLSEQGEVAFDVFRQAGQANHFTLFETWTSPATFVQHGKGVAAIAFRKSISPLLGALYDERIYRRLN